MDPSRHARQLGSDRFLQFVRELPEPSPRELFARLEELGYRGQVNARRALCLMAYRHVRRVKRIYIDGVDRSALPNKSNYLLVGPTGCGKSFLVEQLFREILSLPTALVDITTYSETGYVGQDPSGILTRLLHAADHDPLMASIGIVCLDEFDKIASGQNNAVFAGAGTTKDVTGMGVQRELLKMLETCEVLVPLDLSQGAAHSVYGDNVVLSTADIAFVAAGAFSGFQQLAARRARQGDIGFGRIGGHRALDPEAIAVGFSADEVENIGNFQAYGFLPELIARFTRMVPFAALDAATLTDILNTDVVSRMRHEFADEGFELQVEGSVLAHVVDAALRRETGARGLSSTLTRHLEETAFEVFGGRAGGLVRVYMRGDAIAVATDPAP
ncbi:MAG: ATP-dependent Clp protease ATP-binding subunit ClpX [Haliangiales bacterium]